MNTLNKRNNSIDIFRLLCAYMVVSIHAAPFQYINETLAFISRRVVTRIAVPFFFAVAGYFFIKKLLSGKNDCVGYVKKLLVVYTLWSAIYYTIDIVKSIIAGSFSLFGTIRTILITYFISGSHLQLWFFPALIFAVIATTIAYKLKLLPVLAYCSLPLYIIGCLGCAYYNVGAKIPLLSILITNPYFLIIRRIALMGLPFFLVGYFLNKFMEKYKNINNKKLITVVVISVLVYFAELYFVTAFNLTEDVISVSFILYPMLFAVMVLLLSHPMEDKTTLAGKCRVSANFIYYSHPIFLMILRSIPTLENATTTHFVLTCALGTAIGWLIYKANNKYINKFVI